MAALGLLRRLQFIYPLVMLSSSDSEIFFLAPLEFSFSLMFVPQFALTASDR